jgi:DNA polymerase sigma
MTESYVKSVLAWVCDDSVKIEVFGSGPLQTYLPKSDIDITILYSDNLLRAELADNDGEVSQRELQMIQWVLA